jgi:hypothetical protein
MRFTLRTLHVTWASRPSLPSPFSRALLGLRFRGLAAAAKELEEGVGVGVGEGEGAGRGRGEGWAGGLRTWNNVV